LLAPVTPLPGSFDAVLTGEAGGTGDSGGMPGQRACTREKGRAGAHRHVLQCCPLPSAEQRFAGINDSSGVARRARGTVRVV
jgi:hypothetical protein